jgi:hypothetical protein
MFDIVNGRETRAAVLLAGFAPELSGSGSAHNDIRRFAFFYGKPVQTIPAARRDCKNGLSVKNANALQRHHEIP